jgi:hypothetical protein
MKKECGKRRKEGTYALRPVSVKTTNNVRPVCCLQVAMANYEMEKDLNKFEN